MQKLLVAIGFISFFAVSCASLGLGRLTSTTTIPAQQSFVLGQGIHGSYTVSLRNVADKSLSIKQIAGDGSEKMSIIAQPNKWLTVAVPNNTTLVIQNPSQKSADVQLKVTGDTNLSMGYKGK